MHELEYSLTLSRPLPAIRRPAFPIVLIGNQIADSARLAQPMDWYRRMQ
jgi:hypothetical protein